MARHLLIVSREDLDLHAYVADRFADDPTIEVVLDRRLRTRRQLQRAVGVERRRHDRRMRPDVDGELRLRSHVVVTLARDPETVSDAIQWVEAGRTHLPTITEALMAYGRLAQEARVSKQEAELLRAEILGLRAEIVQHRQEWANLSTLATRMITLLNDLDRAASQVAILIAPRSSPT